MLINTVFSKSLPLIFCLFTGCMVVHSDAVLPQNDDLPKHVALFLQDSTFKLGKKYTNGFEKLTDFKEFYITPQNHKKSSSHDLVSNIKRSGNSAHKAWMYGKNSVIKRKNTNHRAYPTFQMNKTEIGVIKTKALVEFWVWIDVELADKEHKNWLSLATFTSYADTNWFRSYLVNVDEEYRVHLMHVPQQGQSLPDIYQNQTKKIPQKQWVQIFVLIDYTTDNRFYSPFIAVWLDSELVAASRFSDRADPSVIPSEEHPECLKGWNKKELARVEKRCGLSYKGGLAQLHLGLYAPPLLSKGTVYNDDLRISEIIKSNDE